MVSSRWAASAATAVRGGLALGAAAIILAACGGQHNPVATSPAASAPAAHSSAPAAANGPVHLPGQLLGLKENTSATAMEAISILRKGIASRSMGQLIDEKAAIYGGRQNSAQPFFLLVAGAWARQITSPDNAAHVIQEFLITRGFTDARLVRAGSAGEALVCGRKHVQTGTDTVCEWADHRTFGAALYPPGFTSSLSDAASETREVHSAVVG